MRRNQALPRFPGSKNSLTNHRVKLLIYNSQVTNPTTERLQKLAHSVGIPLVGVTETQPLDQATYVDWMLRELKQVGDALAQAGSGR